MSSNSISECIDHRQQEGAKNATINREVAALERMFRLGQQSTPAKVLRMPHFPHLRENKVRKGFLEDGQYTKLVAGTELWFRALVECGRTYGWRISELLTLKVGQVDLAQRVIRLDPGTTKNSDGREVFMTDALHHLLSACYAGKAAETLYSLARTESRFAAFVTLGRRHALALASGRFSATHAECRCRVTWRAASARASARNTSV